MKNKLKLMTCKRCGWVAFGMSRKEAEKNVEAFNKYYDTLPETLQQEYYSSRRASISLYEHCFFCGACNHHFRSYMDGDAEINGHTLNPIIVEEIHGQEGKRTKATKGSNKRSKARKAGLPKA